MKTKNSEFLACNQAKQKKTSSETDTSGDLRIALLVDVENYKEPQTLFDQFSSGLAQHGKIVKKIAIGGWGHNRNLNNWIPLCQDQKIEMLGHKGFKGKNAADRAIISTASNLILEGTINAIGIYSRDNGFAIAFPPLRIIGAKIIVPKMENDFIPDADIYIPIFRNQKKILVNTTDLGSKLMEVLPQFFH